MHDFGLYLTFVPYSLAMISSSMCLLAMYAVVELLSVYCVAGGPPVDRQTAKRISIYKFDDGLEQWLSQEIAGRFKTRDRVLLCRSLGKSVVLSRGLRHYGIDDKMTGAVDVRKAMCTRPPGHFVLPQEKQFVLSSWELIFISCPPSFDKCREHICLLCIISLG